MHNRRLQIVRRRDACRDDFGFLSVAPIVINGDKLAIAVIKLQGWICQGVGHTEIRQAGTNRAKKHPRRSVPGDDRAADHHVIACVDETARRDIGQLGIDRLIQVVHFEQAYARSVVLAPDNDRISPGIEYSPKRRLQIVGRCQPAVDNLLAGVGSSLQLSLVARSSPAEP